MSWGYISRSVQKAAIIFDCWTPQSARGHGYYGVAIALLASQLAMEGTRPWIFSATTNESSMRGIAKAGFVHRYSMVRRRTVGWQSVTSGWSLSECLEARLGSTINLNRDER